MKIHISDRKLRRTLETKKDRVKHYGPDMAKKIELRLEALDEAASLADFWPPKQPPERCHELEGGRSGTFSMDVKQPYRLLFKPVEEDAAGEPPPVAMPGEPDAKLPTNAPLVATLPPHSDGGAEFRKWQSIKAVDITDIEDTHG